MAQKVREHRTYVQKIMGGWGDMRMYERTFGEFDPHPPNREAFSSKTSSPQQWMVEEFFGAMVYHGLEARLHHMQQCNGKGAPFWVLAEAYNEGRAYNALVWVSTDSFSKQTMLSEPGEHERGRWYPCLVAIDKDGMVVFLCPRLALDGTRVWVAHAKRIVIFIMQDRWEFVDLQQPERWTCEKKGEKKEEDAMSATTSSTSLSSSSSTTGRSTSSSMSSSTSSSTSSTTISWEVVDPSWVVLGQESTAPTSGDDSLDSLD